MKKTHLSAYFADYRPEIQKVLEEVLFLEQQYITTSLHGRSLALKELKEKIDKTIDKVCKQ